MNIIRMSIQAAVKRPIIIILPAVLALFFSAVSSYNPVLPVIMGLTSATGGNFFDGMISMLQLLMEPSVITGAALLAAAAVLLVSLTAGLVLSGYLPIIRKTLEGNLYSRGDFSSGIVKYFFRILFITIKTTIIAGLTAIVMIVAAVPAVIITRAAYFTRPELMTAAVFVDILTAAVLFFGYMFAKVYMIYWYPAAINDIRKPFSYAKRLVDRNFFKIVSRFFIFDIILAAFIYLYMIIPSAIFKFLLGWLFTAAFSVVLVIYIFYSFGEIVVSNRQNDRP